MSLVAKITLEERVGSFVVNDTTGVGTYDYPYGYWPQTILPTWITEAKAYITAPNGSTFIKKINGFGGPGTQAQFMPWDFGMQAIMSGLWQVEVILSGATPSGKNFEYRATDKCVFTKEVECCVDKMTAKTYNVKLSDVFQDEQSRMVAQQRVLLTRALEAKDCCDIVTANNLITQVRLNCRCGCSH